jgi:PAS domain S-box-containing protein
VLVLLAGALGFAQLQRMATRAYGLETALQTLGTHVNRMNGLEWEVIAMREQTIESEVEWREAREAAERSLQALIEQPGADAQVTALMSTLQAYTDSIVKEFALIEQGRTEEAERLDAETVDPLYEFLFDTIADLTDSYHRQAVRAGRVGLGGGLLTVLAALIAMGYLAWTTQSTRRDIAITLAEQRVRRESEERYQSLFEANPHPMWVVDLETLRFLAVNTAAIERFEYSREEFLELTLKDLRPFEDVAGLLHAAQNWNGSSHYHSPSGHRTKHGSIFQAEASCRRLDFGGRPAALSLVQDVTNRLRMEEELRKSHKLEAVGRLAGGVAHDFNNILAGISGFAQLLAASLSDEAHVKQRRYADEIFTSTRRAAGLTQQLLAYSRRQAERAEVLDMNTFLGTVQHIIQPVVGSAIRVEVQKAPDLWPVRIDRGQMEQVIVSLAGYARDTMPQGGSLTLEIWNTLLDERQGTTLGGLPRGEYVAVQMTDTGAGTDEETRTRIFDPFYSSKPDTPGTGLGLAIAHSLVKQGGGFITVESSPGRGTTFRLHLPRTQAEADPPGATPGPAASAETGGVASGNGRQAA